MKRTIRNLLITLLLLFPIAFISVNYLEDLVETSTVEGTDRLVSLVTGLPTHVINVASSAGYPGIFLLMLLESAAFPVPSEIILPLAGYLVFRGSLQYWPVIFCSTIAALLGSFIDYWLGRRLGSPLITGETKLPYLKHAQLQRIQSWFNTHGPATVTILRWVPTARVLVSFPAGACRMNPAKFALYSLIGCLPWNMVLVYLGWLLGTSWESTISYFRYINLFVYLVMAVFLLWVVWLVSVKRKVQPNTS
jgi:membrane protein DedA with SNARE-associated domain